MFNKLFLLAIGTFLFLSSDCQSSPNIPKTGLPFPNPALVNVETAHGKEQVSLSNWRGQPVIVDFFSSFCVVCLGSLPKLEQFREEFKGRVKFLLIAKEDNVIRKVYKKYQERFRLNFDIGYDSILHRDFRDLGYPAYVWIDGNGIVQAVTGGQDLTREKVDLFAKTQKIDPVQQVARELVDVSRPIGENGNGGYTTGFISRTLFAKWDFSQPSMIPPDLFYMQPHNALQLMGVGMIDLYRYAFFNSPLWDTRHPNHGTVFPYPVFEDGSYLTQFTDTTLYSYSLWLDSSQISFTDRRERFKEDIVNQFGYYGRVEYRSMPYYRIIIRPGFKEKLRSRADSAYVQSTHAGLEARKIGMDFLPGMLSMRFQDEVPFIDESSVDFPIDLTFEAIMYDFKDVKSALYNKGIVLELASKPMRVLILSQKRLRPEDLTATKSQ